MTPSLKDSPFAILGVTVRDDRRRIVEVASERALDLDQDVCQRARADLINPRSRLSAEMAWLPGVSPAKAASLARKALEAPSELRRAATLSEAALPPISKANLAAETITSIDAMTPQQELVGLILELGRMSDEIDPAEVLRDVNEDRAVSGFPEVRGIDIVEAELAERRRYYKTQLLSALDKIPTTAMVDVFTEVADRATQGGEIHAPGLIDDLIDGYELESQPFLEKEVETIDKLIAATKSAVGGGEAAIKPYVDKLSVVVRNWDRVAQPIQISAKARGTDHVASTQLAYRLRNLAIDLFNDHEFLEQSKALTALLKDVFNEMPMISERLAEDSQALNEISRKRKDWEAVKPVLDLIDGILKRIETQPQDADTWAEHLLTEGPKIFAGGIAKPSLSVTKIANDNLAMGVLQCAITYGNKTANWSRCVLLLSKAQALATDSSVRQRLQDNLAIAIRNAERLGGLSPLKNAPVLYTVNGIGMKLYGSSEARPDGSVMTTYYFVFFFIPIFPIARYRVIQNGNSYQFLGKGELRTLDKWHIGIALALTGYLLIAANST
jgi:hypothetical protein